MKTSSPVKVGLVGLGGAKNLVDSEVMLGSLMRDGMELTEHAAQADVLIVNTCGFIEASKQESINAILEANGMREKGRCRALIMTGCLTQRYPKELKSQLPEVDAIVGLNEVPRIGEIVRDVLTRKGHAEPELFWSGPAKYVPDYGAPRFRLTPRHYAYVKIAEGCNHRCTFCSIPRIRGRHRSRSIEDVVAEVRGLVAGGGSHLKKVVAEREWVFDHDMGLWQVNGSFMDPTVVSAAPRQGTAEIWTFRNAGTTWSHPVHVHFEEFQVLEWNGRKPTGVLKSRKDVATLGPGDSARVYYWFDDFLGR